MNQRYVRKIRSVKIHGSQRRRVDVTLPEEVLSLASVRVGDPVEIRVTRARRIMLIPYRTSWPEPCGRMDGRCDLAKGHAGECIPEEEVPL